MIDWVALSATTQALGVVAVIGSLIYLALQVRQSSQVAKTTAASQLASRFTEWMNVAMASQVIRDSFLDVDSARKLSAPDTMQLFGYIQILFRMIEEMYVLRRSGFVDDDLWLGWKSWFGNMKAYEIVSFFYDMKRENFSPDFQGFWEDLPESSSENLVSIVSAFKAPRTPG